MADVEKEKFVVRSVRAGEDVFEKLKELSNSGQFSNQGEALAYLVNLYNIEKAKEQVGREAEIENFHGHINRIMDMYLGSLALAADTEDKVRAEFSNRLENQEKSIKELREARDYADGENRMLQKSNAGKDEQIEKLIAERDSARKEAEKAQVDHDQLAMAIANANQVNAELREKLDAQAEAVQAMDKLIVKNGELQKGLEAAEAEAEMKGNTVTELQQQIQELQAKNDTLNRRYEKMQEQARTLEAKYQSLNSETAIRYAALRSEKDNEVKAAELRVMAERQDRYDALQSKYDVLSTKYDTLRDRFDQLKREYDSSMNGE